VLKKVLDSLSKAVDKTGGEGGAERAEKKTSGWKVFFLVIGGIILIAAAMIPAILARRKAAKLAHERDVLLEEKKQLQLKAKLEGEGKARKDIRDEISGKRLEATAIQKKIDDLDIKRKRFSDSVSAITDWGDIPTWGE
jgi:hypothetical protein